MPPELPDIFAFTSLQALLGAHFELRADGAKSTLAEWLGEVLACSPEQVFNLLAGIRDFQSEQAATVARAMRLTEEGLEYLRRLVFYQNAEPDQLKEARLSIWEMHAAHRGIPAEEVAAIFSREHVHGATEGSLLPILAMLNSMGTTLDPREMAPLLVAPPEPARLRAACGLARKGTILGSWVSPRMLAVEAPGSLDALCTAAWHGHLDLTRECVQRVPVAERTAGTITWNVDRIAARAAERATTRVGRDLRTILAQTGESPITRLYFTGLAHVGLTEPQHRDRPAVEIPASVLPVQREWSRAPLGSRFQRTSTDGRPCIYASLRFADFAQPWLQWQKGLGKPCSATILAKRMGVSRSLANNISNGTTDPLPRHVQGVIAAYGLNREEGAYVEGLARYALATDVADKARERRALLDFAASQGVRTAESELWRVSSYWGAQAVWALAFLPIFWANPAWIYFALRGRVPLDMSVELVDALLATGLWVKDPSGAVRPALDLVQLIPQDPEVAGLAANSLHSSVIRMLQHELSSPLRDQHFHGWVLALPDAAVPRVQVLLEAFRKEIVSLLQAAQARASRGESVLDQLFLTNFDFFPVTKRLANTLTPERPRR